MDIRERSNFNEYIAMMEDVYRFVMYSMDDYSKPHDYGMGDVLNMVEMHTLSMIADHPGLSVTDVAKLWDRTLGAASKNVNILCAKGLVTKEKKPGNRKTICLYPTERGAYLDRLHKSYDQDQIAETARELLIRHTDEELHIFHSVISTCIAIYEEKRHDKALPQEKTEDHALKQ